jgi:hypothetical protein
MYFLNKITYSKIILIAMHINVLIGLHLLIHSLLKTVLNALKTNSVAVVRKRTIPTERPPLVGEVSANLCRYKVLRGQRNEFPRPLISVF